jgi:opacity protein-like surface antigen
VDWGSFHMEDNACMMLPVSERNVQIMGKALSLSLLFLLFVPTTWAQDTPQYEVFVGPSYSRQDLTNSKFINGIGWHASLDGTTNSWLSAVFDFSGYYSSPKVQLAGLTAPVPIDSSTYLYLFGPRFTYRKWQRLTPFAEALVGVANFRFTASSVGLTNAISSTTFAGGFGGGADYAVNSWLAIRLIEADYVVTRFREISVDPTTGQVEFSGQHRTQNNARASTGIVIRFGSR